MMLALHYSYCLRSVQDQDVLWEYVALTICSVGVVGVMVCTCMRAAYLPSTMHHKELEVLGLLINEHNLWQFQPNPTHVIVNNMNLISHCIRVLSALKY